MEVQKVPVSYNDTQPSRKSNDTMDMENKNRDVDGLENKNGDVDGLDTGSMFWDNIYNNTAEEVEVIKNNIETTDQNREGYIEVPLTSATTADTGDSSSSSEPENIIIWTKKKKKKDLIK